MTDSFSCAGVSKVSCRSKKAPSGTVISKPNSILLYNKNMGEVVLTDRCLEPYSPIRINYKWFTQNRHTPYLVQILIRNSFVLYQRCGGSLSFLRLTEKVIDHLVLQSGQASKRRPQSLHFQPHALLVTLWMTLWVTDIVWRRFPQRDPSQSRKNDAGHTTQTRFTK